MKLGGRRSRRCPTARPGGGPRSRRRGRRAAPRRRAAPARRCACEAATVPNFRRKPRPGQLRARGCGRAGRSAARPRSTCEGEREDLVSGVRLPPEWLPTSRTGPVLGDVAQPADLAAEVEAREQPQAREVLADVVGVALVEVGGGDPRLPGQPRPPRPIRAGRSRAAAPGRPRRAGGARALIAGLATVARAVGARRLAHAGASRSSCYAAAGGAAAAAPRPGVDSPRKRCSSALTSRALDLRDVPAVLEDDLLGARQPVLDVARERRRE